MTRSALSSSNGGNRQTKDPSGSELTAHRQGREREVAVILIRTPASKRADRQRYGEQERRT
jgi:hypothetical protein